MSFFSRKNAEKTEPVKQPEPVPAAVQPEVKKEIKLPEGPRKEKLCPYCKAPNDDFVSRCWLCKKDI